jgi:two-component system CheB/CheR fusion protein
MNERGRAADNDDTASSRRALPDHGILPSWTGGPVVSGDDRLPLGALDGVSVLLVENDPISREALEFILAYYGARIVSAESMRDALSCYEDALPSIVVSDIGLPDEDGCALIRAIRARELGGERTPAIAISGFPSRETGERACQAGFDAFLRKPIDINSLFRAVRTLISSP